MHTKFSLFLAASSEVTQTPEENWLKLQLHYTRSNSLICLTTCHFTLYITSVQSDSQIIWVVCNMSRYVIWVDTIWQHTVHSTNVSLLDKNFNFLHLLHYLSDTNSTNWNHYTVRLNLPSMSVDWKLFTFMVKLKKTHIPSSLKCIFLTSVTNSQTAAHCSYWCTTRVSASSCQYLCTTIIHLY